MMVNSYTVHVKTVVNLAIRNVEQLWGNGITIKGLVSAITKSNALKGILMQKLSVFLYKNACNSYWNDTSMYVLSRHFYSIII